MKYELPRAGIFMNTHTYSNWQAPLYKASFGIAKHRSVPLNARLTLLLPEPVGGRWFVQYEAPDSTLEGWLEDKYLEPYVEAFPGFVVDMQGLDTPDPHDAAQYAIINKIKQVNLCGELCCCKLLQVGLKDFTNVWGVRNPKLWERIFGSGKARGTGAGELVELLACSGVIARQIDQKQYPRWTPRVLYDMLQNYEVICGCSIDSTNGRLRGAGVGHWITPVEVIFDRQGFGSVKVYNPYPNRLESYSWTEFVASARVPFGCLMTK